MKPIEFVVCLKKGNYSFEAFELIFHSPTNIQTNMLYAHGEWMAKMLYGNKLKKNEIMLVNKDFEAVFEFNVKEYYNREKFVSFIADKINNIIRKQKLKVLENEKIIPIIC
jgi:outer membrane lipoprotein-sorting protein